MSTTASPPSTRDSAALPPGSWIPRPKPVQIWAAIGAAFLLLETYIMVRWVTGPHFVTTPSGPDPVPLGMKISCIVWQALAVTAAVVLTYRVVIRPWRQNGEPSFDGLFYIMLATMVWADPLMNYIQPVFTFNSYLVNVGSWASDIPGWISPNGYRYPEPLLGSVVAYPTFLFAPVLLCNTVMRRASRRWQLGPLGLVVCGGLALVAFDFVIEVGVLIPAGIMAWPGAPSELTLFSGTRFQYPLVELVFGGTYFAMFGMLRYFRDDRGRSFAERGIDDLRVSRRRRTALRFLGIVGVGNVMFVGLVQTPIQAMGIHAGAWPKDIQERSYLSDSICGPRTEYACPAPGRPIQKRDAIRVTPDGRLAPAPPGG